MCRRRRLNSHLAGDIFEITTDGAQVCARRTDSSGGWGMLTSSLPVICADDAGHLGNCVNSHLAGDTFEITTDGFEVCATRTDSGEGWGMHLEIVCVSTGEAPTPEENPDDVTAVAGPPAAVLIDDSSENTKCVTAFVRVICADDAGHLGNRVNSHQSGDTFEFTTDGAEGCHAH